MKISRRSLWVLFAALPLFACGERGDAVISTGLPGEGPRPTVGPVTTAVVQGPPPSAPATPVCQMLSPGDVGGVLGNAVRAGTGEGKFCFWGTQVDKGTSADVTVNIPAQGRGDQACAVQKAALPKDATQEGVGGVGDSAVWSWQPVAILVQGRLVACWPDAIVSVQVTGERDQSVLRQQAVGLAQA
ncbi:MAG: hypothetical protein M3144_06505, partial [Actinomycetota bacterium]|nr:hypothetical protein [Actinomycetota bacterium]